ncbi:hypothetical protein HUN08_08415 [Gordonia sp. X0973]|uniref:hypothetical protein n=1 Tax=Gordonia sp. X0973 TaxID=2742602 RepID=UPI000F523EB3|nr:hypothetical protein [Gordonia sp. X0973]QKT07214.1 hypothetical protein HUN08_08415 [Gordonia sp. X0973]
MTSTDHLNDPAPAYPLATVGPWAAALGAGRCAGDDLLDELAALDMPPGIVDDETGAQIGWLEIARSARSWSLRLPAPGDPDGLPPGPAARAGLAAGEALVVETETGELVIVGDRDPDRAHRWVAFAAAASLSASSTTGMGEARQSLREVVAAATSVLSRVSSMSDGDGDTLRADLAKKVFQYRPVLPPGADARAAEVADLAAQVLATVTLASARRVQFGLSSTQAAGSDQSLSEVTAAARAALAAAVNRVMAEFSYCTDRTGGDR